MTTSTWTLAVHAGVMFAVLISVGHAQVSDLWPNVPGKTTPCPSEGHFPHPTYCDRFYRCLLATGSRETIYHIIHFVCRDGLVFDPETKECTEATDSRKCSRGGDTEGGDSKDDSDSSTAAPDSDSTQDSTVPSGMSTPPSEGDEEATQKPDASEDGDQSATLHCPREGFFRNPSNCNKFYRCVDFYGKNSSFTIFEFDCPAGLVFDEGNSTCNWPDAVVGVSCKGDSSQKGDPSTTPTSKDDDGDSGQESTSEATEGAVSSTEKPQPSGDDAKEDGADGSSEAPECRKEGFFRSPKDCGKFYRCVDIGVNETKLFAYEFDCPEGLIFDESITACIYPEMSEQPCPGFEEGKKEQNETSTQDGEKYSCQSEGFFRDPKKCTEFYRCVKNNVTDKFLVYKFSCPSGLVFDEEKITCNWPEAAKPCGEVSTEVPDQDKSGDKGDVSKEDSSTEKTSDEGEDGDTSSAKDEKSQTSKLKCSKEGFYRDPEDCSKFYRCVDFSGKGQNFTVYQFSCPDGLIFDEGGAICNWPQQSPPCQTKPSSKERSDDEPPSSHASKKSDSFLQRRPTGSDVGQKQSQLKCRKEGYYRHPSDCNKYFNCFKSSRGLFYSREFDCPPGLVFDEAAKICTWPENTTPCYPHGRRNLASPFPLQGISRRKRSAYSFYAPGPLSTLLGTYLVRYGRSEGFLKCPQEGIYAHPQDCQQFYRCIDFSSTGKQFAVFLFVCNDGMEFDNQTKQCVPPDSGACKLGSGTEGTTRLPEDEGTTTIPMNDETTSQETSPESDDSSLGDEEGTQGEGSTTTEIGQTPTDLTTISAETSTPPSETSTNPSEEASTESGSDEKGEDSSEFECTKEGFFGDPKDCNRFYRCVDFYGDGKFVRYSFRCGEGLVFDEEFSVCNWPGQAAPCGTSRTNETTTLSPVEGTSTTSETQEITTASSTGEETSETSSEGVSQTTDEVGTELTTPEGEMTTTITSVESTDATTTTLASKGTTETSSGSPKPLKCKSTGFYRNPNDCTKFYRCVDFYGSGKYTIYEFSCPEGLTFDEKLSVCNWPDQSPACDVSPSSEQSTTPVEGASTQTDEAGPGQETTTSLMTTTTSSTSSTRQGRESVYDCDQPGNFEFEADCERFYNCAEDQDGKLVGTLLRCPEGYVFDKDAQKCKPKPDDFTCSKRPPNDKIFCTNSTIVDNAPTADKTFLDD